MSHKNGTMVYELCKPIKYSKDGEFVEAKFIEFYEYTIVHERQYLKLKQIIDRAIFSNMDLFAKIPQPKKEEEDKDTTVKKIKKFHEMTEEEHEEVTKEQSSMIELSVSVSEDEDCSNRFLFNFKNLLSRSTNHPIAKLNGESVMNENHWNDIYPEEKIKIASRYCAFFGIGLFGQLKEESETVSEQPMGVKEL